jgi:hypothetical protein
MRFAVEEFFPYKSFHARKKKNRVPTSYLQEEHKIRCWVFLSYELLNSGKRRIFLPTSYIQGQVRESRGSRWVRQGWSIATKRGREKVKKRKRPRKARRWLQWRQGSVCPKPRIPFFGSWVFGFGSSPSRLKYWLLRIFSTRKPCAKEVPETDYFTQQKQYLKRTTLRTYSAKAVP